MRSWVPGIAALLLAGCTVPGGAAAEAPGGEITAQFQPGGLSDVVMIRAVDRLPLRSAALIGPDGVRVPAYSLDVASSPIAGVAPGTASLMTMPGAPRSQTRIGTMISTALLRLPDPMIYGRSWRDWRVALRFGDPGGAGRDMVLKAPPPPAPSAGAATPMPSTEFAPR